MAIVVSIVSQFNDRELKRAIRSLDDFQKAAAIAGGGVAGNLAVAGSALQNIGDRAASTGRSLTFGLSAPLALVGAKSVQAAADFEVSMNQMGVATGLPQEKLKSMSDLALKFGADTIFSAGEAAGAMLNLAKNGMTPAEISGGALKATLDLAAASGMALEEAAVVAGASMNTFKLEAKDASQIVDALAGAANASSADLPDLAMALQQAGQQASASGLSIQETTAALAAFADAGVRGSDAGTSFKVFLQRLIPKSDEAGKAMDAMGLSFFDAQGNMKSLTEISDILRSNLKDLTQEQRLETLQTIFGSDALRAANILYEQGGQGIAKYIDATMQSGNAQKMAEARMSGMAGTLENLKGSIETAGIKIGQALQPTVEALANTIKSLVDRFTALSPRMQTTIATIGLLVAGMGPALWIGGRLVSTMGSMLKAGSYAAKGLKYGFTAAMQIKDGFTQAQAAQSAFATGWVKVGGALKSGISTIAETTVSVAKNTASVVANTASTIASTVAQKAAAVASKAWAVAQGILNAVMSANPIMLVVIAIAALVAAFVLAYKKSEKFREIVQAAFGAIKDFVVKAIDIVRDVVSNGFEFMKNLFLNWTAVGLVIKHFDAIKDGIRNAMDFAKNFVRDALDWIRDRFSSIFGGLGGLVSTAFSTVSGAVKGALNGVIGLVNQAISALNKVKVNVPSWVPLVGGKSWGVNIPTIPALATGGIVDSPTLAMIGEAGPEAVVPLSRGSKYGMGTEVNVQAGAIVIQVPGGEVDPMTRRVIEQSVRDGLRELANEVTKRRRFA